jgi:hypothetical protein
VAVLWSGFTIPYAVRSRSTSRTLVGGGKKHGQINYTLEAGIPDKSDPIMPGMSDITIVDEAFFTMTWVKDPPIHLLATVVIPGTPSAGTLIRRGRAADLGV